VLRVAPFYDPLHEVPALLPDDGQERLGDGPGLLVVGEDSGVEVYDLPVLEMTVGVGRERLEQLVTQEQPGAMQQPGGRRSPAPVKTPDDQLITQNRTSLGPPAAHYTNISQRLLAAARSALIPLHHKNASTTASIARNAPSADPPRDGRSCAGGQRLILL